MRRRDLLAAGLALPFIGRPLSASLVSEAQAQERPVPFEAAAVRALARELAQKPYKAPDNKLPDELKDLTYDRYRMIRFKPDQALWRATVCRSSCSSSIAASITRTASTSSR